MIAFTPRTHTDAFLPARPSPLSPRSANAVFKPALFMSKPSNQSRDVPFSKRAAKTASTLRPQSRDETRERRRNMFMKKVQQGREDSRWASRGDQILRSDYVQQLRRWEAEQDQRAPSFFEPPEEDEDENDDTIYASFGSQQESFLFSQPMPQSSNMEDVAEEADAVARAEDEYLDEMISSIENEHETNNTVEKDLASQHFGSGDEDYDSLFWELVSVEQEAQQQSSGSGGPSNDEMDTSAG
ncbi:hypothetical protein K402DRAFT_453278 [Aulographum hederae CBS 113979]|uniref:Uncharacterized protein n=1 Tax=Aulographum hederae CBS 113979 TaxID=1176131 RepID=A0A6G1H4G6_9PEZI|nr:hypothetical protein K402DRAFT_453278 [Aulographum hederae CBS 113979]